MGKIGIAVLDGRIAPVFDVTRELLVVDVTAGEIDYQELILLPDEARDKVTKLTALGVEVLLCGAISNEIKRVAEDEGIEVEAFLRGSLCRVLGGWLNKSLDQDEFYMPGCRRQAGRRHRCQNGFGHGRECKNRPEPMTNVRR